MPSAKGITAHAASAGPIDSTGAMKNRCAVRARRDDDFLEHQLEHVGERLQQSQRADAIGADAHLHPADDLALGQRQVGDAEDQRNRDGDDLGQRPYHAARSARRSRCTGVSIASITAASTAIGPNIGPSMLVDGVRRRRCARSRRARRRRRPTLSIASPSPWRTRTASPSVDAAARASVVALHARRRRRASRVFCSDGARRTSGSAK